MKITISGEAGSGKTSVAKKLAEKLNYKFYSMGNIRGEIAINLGITIDELNKIGEKENWTDKKTDEYQKNILAKKDNLIVEGRLSWLFIPNSFKIFLDAPVKIGACRILKNPRKDEKKTANLKAMEKYIQKRKQSDIKRYKKYYKINPYEHKHYDLIINSENKTIDEIVKIILKQLK